jgi:hypothetical protein
VKPISAPVPFHGHAAMPITSLTNEMYELVSKVNQQIRLSGANIEKVPDEGMPRFPGLHACIVLQAGMFSQDCR